MANLETKTQWKEAKGGPLPSLFILLHAFPFFQGAVACLFVPSLPLLPPLAQTPRKAKNSSHPTQIRGWMRWGFITHWLKWVLWERMGYILIVSLVTSAHRPKKKWWGCLCRDTILQKGSPPPFCFFLISLEKSTFRPGKEMGGGKEWRKGRVLSPSCL